MIHPVVVDPRISQLVDVQNPPAWSAGGSGFSAGLLRYYLSTSGLKALKGGITWDGTPTIGADGVEPGHGPVAAPLYLAAGKVIAVRVKMDKASTGLTGDEQLFGPVYARNGNVVLKWQGSEAVEAATWAVGATLAIRADVVTGALAVEVMA